MCKEVNDLICNLIDLSKEKYLKLKNSEDTLYLDIVFIEKFQCLKETLQIDNLNDIDLREYPDIKMLQNNIQAIFDFEKELKNRQIRVGKAVSAYKKNKNGV